MHKILGNRFMSRALPAWHGLGTIFPADQHILPSEAATKVAGDLNIVKERLYYAQEAVGGFNYHPIPDLYGVLRMPSAEEEDINPTFLGTASKAWEATSYPELAGALDKIDSSIYKVETCGVLEDGKRLFLSLRGEDWEVAKDPMRTYFLAQFSLEPGVGHKIDHSPVRAVCWNTCKLAEEQSLIQLSIPHTKSATALITLAGELLVQFRESETETKAIFQAMAGFSVTEDEAKELFERVHPEPAKPNVLTLFEEVGFRELTDEEAIRMNEVRKRYERGIERARELREACLESYHSFQPEHLAGTLWAAYNACTEVSDWREGVGAEKSLLFGIRSKEKERAYKACIEMLEL